MACKYLKGSDEENSSGNYNDEKQSSTVDSSNSDQYFTYDILRLIFEYLNYNDLRNAGKVCRLWAEAARNEKKKRLAPACIIQDCKDIIKKNKTPWYKVNDESNDHTNKLMIKPSLGLYFTGFKALEKYPIAVYFYNHNSPLLKNVNRVMIIGSGTVMEGTENEHNCSDIICTYLPKTPNVDIEAFVCDSNPDRSMENNAELYINKLIKFFGKLPYAKTHNKRCCLILITTAAKRDIAEVILYMLRDHYGGMILPVWGGIVEHVIFSPCDAIRYETPGCVGIAIAGSGMRSWSYIIDCDTEEKVKEKLTLFRQKVKLQKYSLGFMFACCQRGKELYNKSSVEASAFKAIFPEVILVGCFGYGEFGTTTINIGPKNSQLLEWCNELTTVFLLITYG